MEQALQAFKFSNISVDEKGSTTRVSADVLCLYIALSYIHFHVQYKLYLVEYTLHYEQVTASVTIPVYVFVCVKCIQVQVGD